MPEEAKAPVGVHDTTVAALAKLHEGDDEPEGGDDEPEGGDDGPEKDDDETEKGDGKSRQPAEAEESEVSATDDDGVPTDPDELRKGYLRTADYTRKTQKLAEDRRKLATQQKDMERRLGELEDLQAKLQPRAKPEPETPPEGATAEQLLQWYVKQEVAKARAEMAKDLEPLRPAAETQRLTKGVVDAYRALVDEDGSDPIFTTKSAAELVGSIIESDEDLLDLAKTNPTRAVRLAMKAAKADLANARVKTRSADAHAANPLRPSGGKTVQPTAKSPMDVARDALRLLKREASA